MPLFIVRLLIFKFFTQLLGLRELFVGDVEVVGFWLFKEFFVHLLFVVPVVLVWFKWTDPNDLFLWFTLFIGIKLIICLLHQGNLLFGSSLSFLMIFQRNFSLVIERLPRSCGKVWEGIFWILVCYVSSLSELIYLFHILRVVRNRGITVINRFLQVILIMLLFLTLTTLRDTPWVEIWTLSFDPFVVIQLCGLTILIVKTTANVIIIALIILLLVSLLSEITCL